MGMVSYNPPVLDAVIRDALSPLHVSWEMRARGLHVSLHLAQAAHPSVFVSATVSPLRLALVEVEAPLSSRAGEATAAEFATGVLHGVFASRRTALDAAHAAHRQLLAFCPPWEEYMARVHLVVADLHLGDLDDVEIVSAGRGRYTARRADGCIDPAPAYANTPLGSPGDLTLSRRTLLYGESAALWLDAPGGPSAALVVTPAPLGT